MSSRVSFGKFPLTEIAANSEDLDETAPLPTLSLSELVSAPRSGASESVAMVLADQLIEMAGVLQTISSSLVRIESMLDQRVTQPVKTKPAARATKKKTSRARKKTVSASRAKR